MITETEFEETIVEHVLKSEKPYFQAVWDKRKPFEIRVNDRGFNAGDTVVLKELRDDLHSFTGREIYAKISYVTGFAQKEGYVVFGMKSVERYPGLAG